MPSDTFRAHPLYFESSSPASGKEGAKPVDAVSSSSGLTLKDTLLRSNRHIKIISTCMLLLTAIAVFVALYFGRTILLPLVIAWMASLLLSPIVRWTSQRGVPKALVAALLVGFAMSTILLAVSILSEPAGNWIKDWPQRSVELREKLHLVEKPLSDLKRAGDEVTNFGRSRESDGILVSVNDDSWLKNLATDDLPTLSSQLLIVVVLTFFLLATRGDIARHIGQFGRNFSRRRHLMGIVTQIRRQISAYLTTIALVNTTLALVTSAVLWLLKFPNPLLWGCMVGLLNFAPYVGPLISLCLLTVVGLVSYDDLWTALLPPAAYMVITVLEGQLITPSIVGQRLKLSPIMVFVAVIFWTWIWGVGGALLAAPLLACTKILYENLWGRKSPYYRHAQGSRRQL